jgi:hypothetical protein
MWQCGETILLEATSLAGAARLASISMQGCVVTSAVGLEGPGTVGRTSCVNGTGGGCNFGNTGSGSVGAPGGGSVGGF